MRLDIQGLPPGAGVERINQYYFYGLGGTLTKLTSRSGDVPRGEVVFDLFGASAVVDDLAKGNPLPLVVSRNALLALKTQLDMIFNEFFMERGEDGKGRVRFPQTNDSPVPGWRWTGLTSAIKTFETVFAAELAESATYFVPSRGIYSTPALIDFADQSFPGEIRAHLPDKTKDDWRSAGRCLAFNLLSASGFHVARAVEGMLEQYYQTFTGQPGKTLKGWNDYYVALKKLHDADAKPAPSEKTLAELLQMKDDYRNPIMHPRVKLSEADARMLFNNGESLIIAMAEDLKGAAPE